MQKSRLLAGVLSIYSYVYMLFEGRLREVDAKYSSPGSAPLQRLQSFKVILIITASMENLYPEQKDNASNSCADIGMMLINSYVTMLIFLQIPAQMSILKAEQKHTFF